MRSHVHVSPCHEAKFSFINIVVTGDDITGISQLKSFLAFEFEIKDLGEFRYFLGIEFARSKKGIFLSQRKYVIDLLREVGKLGCKPVETPIDPIHMLNSIEEEILLDRGMLIGQGPSMIEDLHLVTVPRLEAIVVFWRSKKQSVLARSSAEAKYRVMTHEVFELLWLKTLLTKMGIQANVPMGIYCDNQVLI
ncbi:PREDICTED: uncharacterized protein LOC109115270 [Nelumbo nucifera]|uniref:Uncharacterized protein LOC109115270 n=1 Tax=Nelumbo nucifera TaxID=4432 RepID=A0A1U8Q7R7_NELNU|nr:PREDICTED: uncharacterized protein LOC109115270 [Nelumbo nucifera]